MTEPKKTVIIAVPDDKIKKSIASELETEDPENAKEIIENESRTH